MLIYLIAILIGIVMGISGFIAFLRLLATDEPTGFFIVLGGVVFLFACLIIVPLIIFSR